MPVMFSVLGQDLRFGLRMLRRNPGFTTAAVLTLALGIGATTAVFSVANAVVLRPLQFPQSDRAVTVLSATPDVGKAYPPMESLYVEWRDRQRCFDLFAGALTFRVTLRGLGEPRDIPIAEVSAAFLPLIGVQPALGRLFTPEEDRDGRDSVVLLDHGFWQREFAGNPNALGRTIVLNERPVTIIGVLPPDTRFPGFGQRDIWVPLAAKGNTNSWGRGGVIAIGRLRPGVTAKAAQAEMDAVARQIAVERPMYRTTTAVVMPLQPWLVGEVRRTFLMLAGAAAFLLLIACANIANLVLARGTGRRREMAIRASVGAGRGRLAAQMLTESLLLSIIGGVVGMGLAVVAVKAAPAIRAIEIPRAEEIAVDREFLLIGLAISLASGVLFGLAPAFQAWRRDLIASLHRGEDSAGRFGGRHVRDALVAAQLALVMVLLTGAGLMTNTLLRLLNVDLGLTRSNVFTVQPRLPRSMFVPSFEQGRVRAAQYLRQVAEQVSRMPGVESVSVANTAPLNESYGDYRLSYAANGAVRQSNALGRDIDPGYLRTVGIPLLAGRDFQPDDAGRKPVPVVLNRRAARDLFGDEDPLGKVVSAGRSSIGTMEVVGIVGDVRMLGVTKEPGPQAFAPLMGGWGAASVVVVRAAVKASTLARPIGTVVHSLDADAPPPEITTLDERFDDQVAKPRFYMTLLNSFAGLGLILAAIGVYGVMAYTVARRTHEFGIRFALGAQPANIVRLILLSGARAVGAGIVVGLAGALLTTRLLASLLFEVKPRDPLTFTITGVSLVSIALAACFLAARRATTLDVNEALRRE